MIRRVQSWLRRTLGWMLGRTEQPAPKVSADGLWSYCEACGHAVALGSGGRAEKACGHH